MAESKTRVAIAGAGYIASYHVEILRTLSWVEVVGVVDVELARAQQFARKHGIAHAAASVDELCAQHRPQVVHVLTPPALHAAVAEQCLRLGCGVFVEKPLATSSVDARRLVELARSASLPLGVNHNQAFHPLLVAAERLFRSGRAGHLQQVLSVTNVPLRQLESGDFSHFMFKAPGNIILEQAPHPFSQILRLIGRPQRVTALASPPRLLGPGLAFHDAWQVAIEGERGAAVAVLNFGRELTESTLHLIGQDAAYELKLDRGLLLTHFKTRYADFFDQFLNGAGNAARFAAQSVHALVRYALATLRLCRRNDAFYLGMHQSIARFHRALRAHEPLPCSGEDGLLVVELCEQVIEQCCALPAPAPRPSSPPAAVRPGEVVVVGASGFIGRHVIAALQASGRPLTAVLRRPELAPRAWQAARVRVVRGDLGAPDELARAIAGAAAVVHLATGGGESWADFERVMIGGTRALAEACLAAGVKQLVYSSSSAAYDLGDPDRVITEDSPLDPRPRQRAFYARAKIACETLLRELHQSRGLNVTILRPAIVLGDSGSFRHSGFGLWTRDNHCIGWGAGTSDLPLVLVEDVAQAVSRVIAHGALAGQSFNLAGDISLTARAAIACIARISGRPVRFHPQALWHSQLIEIGKWLIKRAIRRPGAVFPSFHDLRSRTMRSRFDCSRAKQVLGWQPEQDRERFLARAFGWLAPAAPVEPGAEQGAVAARPEVAVEQ